MNITHQWLRPIKNKLSQVRHMLQVNIYYVTTQFIIVIYKIKRKEVGDKGMTGEAPSLNLGHELLNLVKTILASIFIFKYCT